MSEATEATQDQPADLSDDELSDLIQAIASMPMIDQICRGNERYGVLVYNYLFGQFRIQLTDCEQPDSSAPEGHGSILLLLDTYNPDTLQRVVNGIFDADDPPAFCMSHARPWNTDFVGDRIRLDNKPEDRPERTETVTPIEAPIDEPVYVRCEGDSDMDIPRAAMKRLEAAPDGDGYVFFFFPIDIVAGERDEPLIDDETGKSSVVECFVPKEAA